MATKTGPTDASVDEFLGALTDPAKRTDSERLVEMMQAATGEPPVLWGSSIIGFGSRHYRYASGHEGDTALIGFSPRAAALTLYLSLDHDEFAATFDRLGKHKLGKSCLYVKRLADVDETALGALIEASVAAARALESQP
ncbi:DUF1801 domain-containing protein [Rhodococcus tukisamuensis]|uniref:YdhG-like domain-containing protein n=1 Tax=Rhodococcus tukisamuensis TaxID=168276 RepID=A0A1G6Z9A4_9NOCA|nr:DUF1801 domain-containing protein [Rhodococcus tukisamuensis]SDD98863.1 protein of unknown function (DU1801) [Rhodococcus tukisamuensis]